MESTGTESNLANTAAAAADAGLMASAQHGMEVFDENAQFPFDMREENEAVDVDVENAGNEDSGLGSSNSAMSWSDILNKATTSLLPTVEEMDTGSPARRVLKDLNGVTPIKTKRFAKLPFRNNAAAQSRKLSTTMYRKKVEERFLKRPSPKALPRTVVSLEKNSSKSMVNMTKQGKVTSPESIQTYCLRTMSRPQVESSAFKSIDGSVLATLIQDMGDEKFRESFTLIDCRYPYEYDGGHIRNAINKYEFDEVKDLFYADKSGVLSAVQSKIPIFYCEFSQARGPKMANALRRFDRELNSHNYPHLDYPEIYLLDSGYRGFFSQECCLDMCEPRQYVQMHDSEHQEELRQYHYHKKRVQHQM